MRKLIWSTLLAVVVPAGAWATQAIDFSSVEALRTKASNVVSVNIGPELIQFAAAFMSSDDEDEAAARAVIEGLEGIQVRVFEFDGPDGYAPADLVAIQDQLNVAGWVRIVEVHEDNEEVGVWMFMPTTGPDGPVVEGLVVLVQEPSEVVLVNIAGTINPSDMAALGQLGALGGLENLGGFGDLEDLGDLLNQD
jgi:hypothetical protein